jgi:hypothetical protein
VPAGGPVAAVAALGRIELVHFDKFRMLDPLHDELCDPVTARQLDRLAKIMVYQADPDLTAVSRVDRAGRVDHRKPDSRGQTGPRVDEPRVADR